MHLAFGVKTLSGTLLGHAFNELGFYGARWAADTLPAGASICGVLCGDDGGLADAERSRGALALAITF